MSVTESPGPGSANVTVLALALFCQGLYYAVTGVWALAGPDSFQFVTGPKTDLWLVRTVAVLVLAIGASLAGAALSRVSSHAVLLSLASALGLFTVDVSYAATGVISKVYLADAAAQAAFVIAVAWGIRTFKRQQYRYRKSMRTVRRVKIPPDGFSAHR